MPSVKLLMCPLDLSTLCVKSLTYPLIPFVTQDVNCETSTFPKKEIKADQKRRRPFNHQRLTELPKNWDIIKFTVETLTVERSAHSINWNVMDLALVHAYATPKKPKRSTTKGEAKAKLVAALTKHHEYADGGCLNQEPIGNNELARLAKVSESTASAFFKKQFDGHMKYRAICGDTTKLVASLKLLNQEFVPHHLFGAKPPGEGGHDNED